MRANENTASGHVTPVLTSDWLSGEELPRGRRGPRGQRADHLRLLQRQAVRVRRHRARGRQDVQPQLRRGDHLPGDPSFLLIGFDSLLN